MTLPKASRIMVIGSGGAGKTTFALKLAERLHLPVIHLDRHFWKPGWVQSDDATWRKTVSRLVRGSKWIMDGNYRGSFDIRFPRADLVIYLDFPTGICLFRALKRCLVYSGKSRPDIHPGCPERMDLSFLLWILNFRRRNRLNIRETIRRLGMEKKILILKNPADAQEYLFRWDSPQSGLGSASSPG